MSNPKLLDLQDTNMVSTIQNVLIVRFPVMGTGRNSTSAVRMRALRAFMGYAGHGRSKEFAEDFLGITPSRWSNVENGKPVGGQLALLLARKCPQVGLDWIMTGDSSRLMPHVAKSLGDLSTALGNDINSAE